MDRSRIRKLVATGCAVTIVGVALALAAPSIGSAPPAPLAPATCIEFARDVDPMAVPVDSGYDPEKNLVYAHHGGRTYVLRPADPICRALSGARSVIDDAVRTDRDNTAVTCREVSGAVAQGRSEMSGRRFDRDAARRYLTEACEGS